MEQTLALTVAAPSEVSTLTQAEAAVEWLRAKRAFDEAVDESYKDAIQSAHKTHKALIQAANRLKSASDTLEAEVRARLDVYAGNCANSLPEGVYRREVFNVYVTDPGLVPDVYKSPDLALIKTFVKHTGGSISIPGVVIEKETRVTVRGDDNG